MYRSAFYILRILTSISLITLGLVSGAIAQVQPNPPTEVWVEGGANAPSPSGSLFFDNFEFVADRSGVSQATFTNRGWNGNTKATNIIENSGGRGYLYTQDDATLGSRVLVMESQASLGQTDYFVQYGNTANDTVENIPGNVWFQFWTFATPASRFDNRDKVLYPSRMGYPSTGGNEGWMFMWGRTGFEPNNFQAPPGGRFICIEPPDANWANHDPGDSAGRKKLYQNVSQTPMLAGIWYQVKLHMDTSGAQGVYQAWIRERGQSNWLMVADWRGGVTPGFTWPLTAERQIGHRTIRFPTTVNAPAAGGDSTTYVDDFGIYTSDPG